MGAEQSKRCPDNAVLTFHYVPYDKVCLQKLREWVSMGNEYQKVKLSISNALDRTQTPGHFSGQSYPFVTIRDLERGGSNEELMCNGKVDIFCVKKYIDDVFV